MEWDRVIVRDRYRKMDKDRQREIWRDKQMEKYIERQRCIVKDRDNVNSIKLKFMDLLMRVMRK